MTFSDLYTNEVGHVDDNNYASDNNWKDKDKPEQDTNLVADTDIDEDELEDNNDLGK